jgi:hypothetical protein
MPEVHDSGEYGLVEDFLSRNLLLAARTFPRC